MEPFLTYLLKSTAVLSIFYLVYLFLLKNETSFVENRKFLLGGIIASAVLPAVYFTRKVFVEAPNSSINEIPISTNATSEGLAPYWGTWEIVGIIYLLVSAFFLIKIAVQLFNIYILIRKSNISDVESYRFIKTDAGLNPFSFFKFIVYNPAAHSEKDLKMILLHEKVHASQWHSVDILIANLTTALLWFNPLSWYYKKSLEQNLEYIADRETVAISGTKKSYQQTLVKVSIPNLQPSLTNQFYQSFIKKRILMLNKESTQNFSLLRISLVFPLILAFLLTFNVKTEAQTKEFSSEISNSIENFKITVYNTASDQKLEEFSKLAKENNILLKFTKVKRNKEGKISDLQTTFQDLDSNKRGILGLSKSEGIAALVFSQDSDGNISMFPATENIESSFSPKTSEKNENKLAKRSKKSQEIPLDPLYILNGEKSKKEIIDLIDPKLIESVNVLKDESAVSLYGEDAKVGAVIITTKNLDKSENKAIKVESHYIGFQKLEKKTDYELMTNNSFSTSGEDINAFQKQVEKSDADQTTGYEVKSKIFTNGQQQASPLVVIDGKRETAEFMKNEIQPEEIEKINVLKGAGAIKKYGKEAKDGVIEVTTKKAQE